MKPVLVLALIATVVLLGTMTYFLMGSLGLLVVRHETPVDSLVVRGFFGTYYWVALVASVAAGVAFAAAGQGLLAVGGGALALAAFGLRFLVVPRMGALHARIAAGERSAVPAFRRWHAIAILINFGLLVATVAALIGARLDLT